MGKKFVCCLCGKITEGCGNDSWPFIAVNGESKCCDKCNEEKVVPERLKLMFRER